MPTSVLGQRERASCVDSLRARLGPAGLRRAWRQGHPSCPPRRPSPGPSGRLGAGAPCPGPARRRPALAPGRSGEPGWRRGARGPGAAAPPFAGALSAREREVAALIAHGLTNRQLAERLYITPGTAANHVVHILNKLGLSTRSQIAAVGRGAGAGPPGPPAGHLPAHVPLGAQ